MPVHAKQGLFTVTIEGREAKHISLQKLSVNTTHQKRWYEIFRHEFIVLIWLPEQQHEPCLSTASKSVYIPQRVFNDNAYCYCGSHKVDLTGECCSFCKDKLKISASVRERKIVSGLV